MTENVLQCFNFYYQGEYDSNQLEILDCATVDSARGKTKRKLNNLFIMIDTETSKTHKDSWYYEGKTKKLENNYNYVVAWSIAVNIYGFNVLCIYGHKPTELVNCMQEINSRLKGTHTIYYIHNASYDYVFLRKFMFRAWGEPVKQLNTKPHYPISIEFANGIILRDSYILSNRSLEKWGKDLDAEHAKAVGKWDYNKIRHQNDKFSDDEIIYICNDVLCGVECLNITRSSLHKTYGGMPYTQTGIVRTEARKIGGNKAHQKATASYSTLEDYLILRELYHGGYCHANRNITGFVIDNSI